MQFLYYKVVQLLYCQSSFPILQNGPVTVFSHCSSYTFKRCSYCIVTVQFLFKKRSSYCIVTVQTLYYKTVQLLYCHITIPILQKWSRYCIVTLHFLYYKTVQLLYYSHIVAPMLQTVQLLYCHSAVPILQNGPVSVLSQFSSNTTKRSSYCIIILQFLSTKWSSYNFVTFQFLYHKRSS